MFQVDKSFLATFQLRGTSISQSTPDDVAECHSKLSALDSISISAQHASVFFDINRTRRAVREAPVARRSVYKTERPDALWDRQRQHPTKMKVVISVVLLQLVALLLCDTVVSMDGNGHHHGHHGHGKYFLSRVSY